MYYIARRVARSRYGGQPGSQIREPAPHATSAGRCPAILARIAERSHHRNARPRARYRGEWLADVSKLKLSNVGPVGLLSAWWRFRFSRPAAGFGRARAPSTRSDARPNSPPRRPTVYRGRRPALVAPGYGIWIED